MVDITATITQPADINVTLDGGVINFLGLTDTPSVYTGESGKVATVNSGETALEFTNAGAVWGGITGTLTNQTDLNTALGLKADSSALTSHTGDSTIHFIQSAISIPASQISDFDTEVSNNSSVTANTAKVTNVSTDLSEGTNTETTVDVNSSDGTNATLVSASTLRAGLLTKAKFDEIVANTSAKHTQGTDTTLGAQAEDLDMNGNAITAITNIEYTGQSSSPVHTLTDETTITPDFNNGDVQKVTLTDNRTLANPSNQKSGATYLIIVIQDAGGTNTLTFGNNYKWSGGTAPTLTTAGDAVDLLTFVSDGTNMYGVFQGDFS